MRKTNSIINIILVGIVVATMAGCGHTGTHETHIHDESLQLTAYNNLFEVFAEVTPFVVNESSEVVAHFTWLHNFKPLLSADFKTWYVSAETYNSGEMTLLNYILEIDYYLSTYTKQLQAQRDLELTLSELNAFCL